MNVRLRSEESGSCQQQRHTGDTAASAGGPSDPEWAEARPSFPARALLVLVHAYRFTAMMRSPRCRFMPTCSSYAVDALREHGGLKGTLLAVRRVGRCHPWNPGGIDPVPPRK